MEKSAHQPVLRCSNLALATLLVRHSNGTESWNFERRKALEFIKRLAEGGIMVTFFVIGIVAGVLLGLRSKTLVLVPASVLITLAVIFASVANGLGYWTMVLTIIATVLLLQCGYIIGCIMQVFIRARLSTQMTHISAAPGTPRA